MAYGLAGWLVVARTIFFDEQIKRLIEEGAVDCVLNLAAALNVEVRSSWKESQRLGRLPWWLGLIEGITPRKRRDPHYNLARVARFERVAGEVSLRSA